MSGRCRRVYDAEIGWWDLPGCIGSAVYGPSGCTCPSPQSDKTIEERLRAVEEAIATIASVPTPNTKGAKNDA